MLSDREQSGKKDRPLSRIQATMMRSVTSLLRGLILVIGLHGMAAFHARAEERQLDTSDARLWKLSEATAQCLDGELRLDGRRKMSRAFYLPLEWNDVSLSAKFSVEPQAEGVLACGFMVRAQDGSNYYYAHFDRAQAILVRHSTDVEWNEIRRVGGLEKPAGVWHEGKLECSGNRLRVWLNGKMLYEVEDAKLAGGRVGFYASQGLVRVKDVVANGRSQPAATPLEFPPPKFVTVCDDGGAGRYEAFPDVCRLRDGRLMCVFYAGYGHISIPNAAWPQGGRISVCTSSDEGRTWSPAATLFDGPDDDRDPSIVQLRDGRLICNFFRLRKSEQPGTEYDGLGSWMVVSEDQGKTWSAPQLLTSTYYCSSPIRELSTGRLVLGLYRESRETAQGAVIYSDDGGKSWSREVDIDDGGVRLDAETDLIELRDGTLYAAQRPQMSFSISKDRGATWSVSKPMGFAGHCPYFHRTVDNIILLAHRLPQTSLHYSLDECATWSSNVPIDDVIGAYPSMVNLRDGTVLVVYYEEGGNSNIRAKRLRADRQGLTWLPFDAPTAAGR